MKKLHLHQIPTMQSELPSVHYLKNFRIRESLLTNFMVKRLPKSAHIDVTIQTRKRYIAFIPQFYVLQCTSTKVYVPQGAFIKIERTIQDCCHQKKGTIKVKATFTSKEILFLGVIQCRHTSPHYMIHR
jgi:hypothetical protein